MPDENRGGGRGKGGPEIKRAQPSFISRESPRVAIPSVLMEVLKILERNLDSGPSSDRIELKRLCMKLVVAYPYLKYPWKHDPIESAHEEADEERGEDEPYGF